MDEVRLLWGAIVEGVASPQEMRLALWFLGLAESLAWHEGVLLKGVTFKRDDGFWRVTVRASQERRNGEGRAVVTFTSGDDMADCIQQLATNVSRRTVTWFDDKYS